MQKCRKSGRGVTEKAFNVPPQSFTDAELSELVREAHFNRDQTDMMLLDAAMKGNTDAFQNDISK